MGAVRRQASHPQLVNRSLDRRRVVQRANQMQEELDGARMRHNPRERITVLERGQIVLSLQQAARPNQFFRNTPRPVVADESVVVHEGQDVRRLPRRGLGERTRDLGVRHR